MSYVSCAEIKAPDSDQTLLSTWDGKVGRLGSGSDYTVFLDVIGIPSMGMWEHLVSVYRDHRKYEKSHSGKKCCETAPRCVCRFRL